MIYQLLIGHLVGDFYLQTEKLTRKKSTHIRWLLVHVLTYCAVIGFIISPMLFRREFKLYFTLLAIVFISHFVIDYAKNKLFNGQFVPFLVDQLLHIVVLMWISVFWEWVWTGEGLIWTQSAVDDKMFAIIACILVCAKPVSILIRLTMDHIWQPIKDRGNESFIVLKEKRIGSYIGILERELIVALVLFGQFGLIGFVLAAKSLARFKQLESIEFAEKYLVGTLLSVLIAIVLSGLIHYL